MPRDVDFILHAVRVSSGRCGNMVMNPRTNVGTGLDPDEGLVRLSSTQVLVVKPVHFNRNFQRSLEGQAWSHGTVRDVRRQA